MQRNKKKKLTKEEKIALRAAIKAKKAQWREEDKLFDQETRERLEDIKKELAESKLVKAEFLKKLKEDPKNQELKEEYIEFNKKHEHILQRYRIEKNRLSLGYKLDRFSKRGGRLRRELYINRQYYYLVAPYTFLFLVFTVIPVIMSLSLVLPTSTCWNYHALLLGKTMRLFIDDKIFVIAVRSTLILAVITGPISYIAAFVLPG